MKKVLLVAFAAFSAFSSMATAECAATSPNIAWNLQPGDQRVSGAYLAELLVGRNVRFSDGGVETCRANGTFRFKAGSRTNHADRYRFYQDGERCIDYPNIDRYDLYVVNNGKLRLIADGGTRFDVRVTN